MRNTATSVSVAICLSLGTGVARAEPKPTPKAFKVDLAGLSILPSTDAPTADRARDVGNGEDVFRAPLAFESIAMLERPVTFDLYGKSVTFEPGRLLIPAIARGGDLDRFATDHLSLCADPEENFAKQLAAATTLMLSTLFSRFHPWTQTCLVDTDRDGAVDHALMVGTRMAADRHLIAIPPTPYVLRRDMPIHDGYLALTFYKPGGLATARIEARVVLSGVAVQRLAAVQFGADGKRLKVSYGLGGTKTPRTVELGDGQIAIDRLSADGAVATVRYVRNISRMPFAFEQAPNVIYIAY